MSARLRILVCALVLTVVGGVFTAVPDSVSAAEQCTITWTKPANGSWNVWRNWSPQRLPDATDFVCLPHDRAVWVALGTSTTVAGLTTGASTLVFDAGVTLTVTTHLGVTGSGGLRGPGTVVVDVRGTDRRVGTELGGPDQPRLEGGVRLQSHGKRLRAGGRLWLGGGSSVTADGTYVQVGDFTVAGDRAPGTLWDTGMLYAYDENSISFGVPVHLGGAQVADCHLSVPYLVGARPDGRIDLTRFEADDSTVAVPYPVTTVVGTSLAYLRHTSVVVASTGQPALAGLRQVRQSFYVGGALHTAVPLTVTGGVLLDPSTRLEATSVTVAPGAVVDAAVGSVVQLGNAGRGALTLGASADPRSTLRLSAATVAGDLVQRNGEVDVDDSSRVTGSWTSTSSAQLRVESKGDGSFPPTTVTVDGRADLRGSLLVNILVVAADPPQRRVVLVQATGGLTADFSQVDLPRHWALSTTPTTLVMTYTG